MRSTHTLGAPHAFGDRQSALQRFSHISHFSLATSGHSLPHKPQGPPDLEHEAYGYGHSVATHIETAGMGCWLFLRWGEARTGRRRRVFERRSDEQIWPSLDEQLDMQSFAFLTELTSRKTRVVRPDRLECAAVVLRGELGAGAFDKTVFLSEPTAWCTRGRQGTAVSVSYVGGRRKPVSLGGVGHCRQSVGP